MLSSWFLCFATVVLCAQKVKYLPLFGTSETTEPMSRWSVAVTVGDEYLVGDRSFGRCSHHNWSSVCVWLMSDDVAHIHIAVVDVATVRRCSCHRAPMHM